MVADANRKANEIVSDAEKRSKEIRKAASDFLDSSLKKTEEVIGYSLGDVKKARQEFKAAMAKMKSNES
jgi:F0F1-type ATP synthase membrane subunit b/b'